MQQPATNNVGVVSTTLTRRLKTVISTDTKLCSLKLRQVAPDIRQDIVEGVEVAPDTRPDIPVVVRALDKIN